MKIEIIGFVKNDIKKHQFGNFAGKTSKIVINNKFAKALNGIKDYSHLIVVYWMDQTNGIIKLQLQPQGNPNVPKLGIFATRCQWRPNPIGISTVPLISVKKNIIKVKGLDILDNTPIIDIKPYLPDYDKPDGKIKIPKWTRRLVYK